MKTQLERLDEIKKAFDKYNAIVLEQLALVEGTGEALDPKMLSSLNSAVSTLTSIEKNYREAEIQRIQLSSHMEQVIEACETIAPELLEQVLDKRKKQLELEGEVIDNESKD